MSISIAAVKNISKLTTAIVPYLLLLVSFAGFVAWNGGVVLGKIPGSPEHSEQYPD